jgi:hypothetical protein
MNAIDRFNRVSALSSFLSIFNSPTESAQFQRLGYFSELPLRNANGSLTLSGRKAFLT